MKTHYVFLAFLLLIFGSVEAQTATRTKHFNTEKGLAIKGYDPVAYFIQNKPVKGNPQITVSYDGITYFFTSIANKEAFQKDYKKYEPQYGGWCAYAMGSSGEKVEIDPETFKIVDGKLYLFYHTWVNNTLTKWNKQEAKLKSDADKNWLLIFK